MIGVAEAGDGHGLPLQVAGGTDLLGADQLDAAAVPSREDQDRGPRVYTSDARSPEGTFEVRLAGSQALHAVRHRLFGRGVDGREPLGLEQGFSHILGRDTDATGLARR